ncbi:hypothetical protein [uncultured Kocuria sp.]|uniref:hypothetical protein n=1 Tax=uncultured Kocuria sp. TaxID=259305 RepID=UPI0026253E58|nr:hypothetical protein [uncultured Kocuria sp.]
MSDNNTSGYKGVSKAKTALAYTARIGFRGEKVYIGYYADPLEAAWMYDQWALELHGEFAQTNLIYK